MSLRWPPMIEITHNFDPARFVWLWSKYVTGLTHPTGG
jgi:hypothetical protein